MNFKKTQSNFGQLLSCLALLGWLSCVPSTTAQQAGNAVLQNGAGRYRLGNAAIEIRWDIVSRHITAVEVRDNLQGRTISLLTPFAVLMKDGTVESLHTLHADGEAMVKRLTPDTTASRYAERLAGTEVDVPLVDDRGSLHLIWSVVLRDGSAYLRQILTLVAGQEDIAISRVQMVDLVLPDAHVVGSVKGSPITAGNLFVGLEDPLSESNVLAGHATAWITRELPLKATQWGSA